MAVGWPYSTIPVEGSILIMGSWGRKQSPIKANVWLLRGLLVASVSSIIEPMCWPTQWITDTTGRLPGVTGSSTVRKAHGPVVTPSVCKDHARTVRFLIAI
jgi:hypothetical protein